MKTNEPETLVGRFKSASISKITRATNLAHPFCIRILQSTRESVSARLITSKRFLSEKNCGLLLNTRNHYHVGCPEFCVLSTKSTIIDPCRPEKQQSCARTATTNLERDFDEALKVIQEQYVGGRQLDYNSVFKSSIIGMLRSLDPHSNYYDRDEFDELKTDQRSNTTASAPLFKPIFMAMMATPTSRQRLPIRLRNERDCDLAIASWRLTVLQCGENSQSRCATRFVGLEDRLSS
jgi:hypothetical protein